MRCRPERCPGVYTPVLSTGWPTAEAGVYVAKARVVMQVPTSLRWLLPDVLRLGRRLRLLLELAGRSQSLPSLMRQLHVQLGRGYRVPVTVRALMQVPLPALWLLPDVPRSGGRLCPPFGLVGRAGSLLSLLRQLRAPSGPAAPWASWLGLLLAPKQKLWTVGLWNPSPRI